MAENKHRGDRLLPQQQSGGRVEDCQQEAGQMQGRKELNILVFFVFIEFLQLK